MTATAAPRARGAVRPKVRRLLKPLQLYLALIVLAIVFMGPFVWTVFSSLKTAAELYVFPPRLLPDVVQWHNYAEVLDVVPFLQWTKNSLTVTVLALVGAVLSSSFVACSFARFHYPGRDLFFLITLGTMMLPAEVTIIPSYLLFFRIGWLDTLKPLIVPAWLGGGALQIFLMRQFFMSIPRDLDEAAYMDGANPVRVFWSILMPLSKPALATLAVIGFVGLWGDFMGPLIYLNSAEKFTLSVGLRYFQTVEGYMGSSEPREHLLMAASVMMVAPPITLFFLAQRYFVQGIIMTGIKG